MATLGAQKQNAFMLHLVLHPKRRESDAAKVQRTYTPSADTALVDSIRSVRLESAYQNVHRV